MDVEQGLQVADLLGIAQRRAKLIVSVAGVIILATYWIAMALPDQYTASSTILVEPQAVDESLVAAGVRGGDLKERLGIMTSQILRRTRLSRLIDDLGLYAEESKRMVRQDIIDLMRTHVSVTPVLSELEAESRNARELDFNTFRITYQSRTAAVAAEVADSIADDFINANIDVRVRVSQKSLDFMEDSIASLTGRIAGVESQIKKVKSENSGRLPEDMEANQRILQATMSELRDAQHALDLSRSDQAFWQNQIYTAASMAPRYYDPTSPQERQKRGLALLATLLSRGFTDRHPDVLQARTELEIIATEMEAGHNDGEEVLSFAEQNAQSEHRRSTLRAEAAEAEVARLVENIQGVEQRIAATPAVAELLSALSRNYDQLFSSYADFSTRRQQALVQANLERKQLGEQFRILEAAFKPTRPSSPNRMLILILGVMLGAGFGVAIGMVVESADSSLHQPRDTQLLTNIPVLASIPNIILEPDRLARNRRQLREILVATMVVLACLVGGAMTNFYVNGWPAIFSAEVEDEDAPEATDAQASFSVPAREENRS